MEVDGWSYFASCIFCIGGVYYLRFTYRNMEIYKNPSCPFTDSDNRAVTHLSLLPLPIIQHDYPNKITN